MKYIYRKCSETFPAIPSVPLSGDDPISLEAPIQFPASSLHPQTIHFFASSFISRSIPRSVSSLQGISPDLQVWTTQSLIRASIFVIRGSNFCSPISSSIQRLIMASNSHRGGEFYGAAPYRSREGLSTRPVAGSDEIQLRIDPMHADLDDEITGLRKQVRQLRNVAQEIESEAKFQNDFINQLQMTMIKAQAGLKNNLRRLNKSIVWQGSNHIIHVILFALLCFFVVYFWSKFSRR